MSVVSSENGATAGACGFTIGGSVICNDSLSPKGNIWDTINVGALVI